MFEKLGRTVQRYNDSPFACAKYLFYFLFVVKAVNFANSYIDSAVPPLRVSLILLILLVSLICIGKFSQTAIIDYRRLRAGTLKLTKERVVVNATLLLLMYILATH